MTPALSNPNFTAPRFRFSGGANDAFTRELRERAAIILGDPVRLRRGRWLLWAKAALWAAIFLGSYGVLLSGPASGWLCLALAFGAGMAALMLAISAGHDAVHGAFFASAALNRATAIGTFALLGVDGNLWQRRHNGSHHPFPNVSGCDVDIDQNPVIRLSPHHPSRPWQRWQHLYAPLAYALVQFHSIVVGDAIYLFRRRLANITRDRPAAADVAIFATTKLLYVTLAFLVPATLLQRPWWQIAGTWLGVSALTSITFIGLLIGTHFVEGAAHPRVAPDGTIAGSWAGHQLATALDWNPESRFANWISGGANAHAAHHLFPRVPHVHYVALTPVIRALARRHGMPYNRASFTGMVASHWRFLRGLARQGASLANWRQPGIRATRTVIVAGLLSLNACSSTSLTRQDIAEFEKVCAATAGFRIYERVHAQGFVEDDRNYGIGRCTGFCREGLLKKGYQFVEVAIRAQNPLKPGSIRGFSRYSLLPEGDPRCGPLAPQNSFSLPEEQRLLAGRCVAREYAERPAAKYALSWESIQPERPLGKRSVGDFVTRIRDLQTGKLLAESHHVALTYEIYTLGITSLGFRDCAQNEPLRYWEVLIPDGTVPAPPARLRPGSPHHK